MDAFSAAGTLRDLLVGRLDPLTRDSAAVAAHSDLDLGPPPVADHLQDEPAPAAVLICLRERAEGASVVLTRRAEGLRQHTGQVALPGGRCEPGESAPQAAVREAEEEVGLPRSAVELIGLSTPYRTITAYHVTPVVGFASPDIVLRANPGEVAAIFEAPFAVLMDLDRWETREGRSPAGDLRRYYAMEWGGQLIWGATAGMLRALSERLHGGSEP